jgi:Hemagglutinin repeat
VSGQGVTITGNYSHSRSTGEDMSAAVVNAGGTLTIATPGDLSVKGGSLRGTEVDVTVGGNLTLESVQDWSRSRSTSVGGGITIGPNGIPLPSSFNYGQTSGSSRTTDAIAEIVGDKRVTVSVGGDAKLVGATILSQQTDSTQGQGLTLTIGGMLETRDLQDHQRTSGYSFGVTGLNNLIGGMTAPTPPATGPPASGTPTNGTPPPNTPTQPTPGNSSTIGGITAGYNNFASQGTTFTVIGQGAITIGRLPVQLISIGGLPK